MELIKESKDKISNSLKELDMYIEKHSGKAGLTEEFIQTQSVLNASLADKDRNFDKIIDQQVHLKYLIDFDVRIESLKKSNREDRETIDKLRRECARISIDGSRSKQDLIEVQSKEIERYQMELMRSIVEDHSRHEKIVEMRKREIVSLRKQIENESKNRSSILKSLENNLEKSLRNRMENKEDDSLLNNLANDVDDQNIELTTVDEYNLYSNDKSNNNKRQKTGGGKQSERGGRGRGRGARKRGD